MGKLAMNLAEIGARTSMTNLSDGSARERVALVCPRRSTLAEKLGRRDLGECRIQSNFSRDFGSPVIVRILPAAVTDT
jgi:hypothetical protein